MIMRHSFFRRLLAFLGIQPLPAAAPPAPDKPSHPMRRASDFRTQEAAAAKIRASLIGMPVPASSAVRIDRGNEVDMVLASAVASAFQPHSQPIVYETEENARRHDPARISGASESEMPSASDPQVCHAEVMEPERVIADLPTMPPASSPECEAPASTTAESEGGQDVDSSPNSPDDSNDDPAASSSD